MERSKEWFVYMLLCDQKTFYIGITTELVNRFSQHKNKLSKATVEFSDLKLVYCEKYLSEHEAALREKQLKGWSHAKKQKLVDGILGRNVCTEYAEVLLKRENL
ncbi:MAG: GIY-YIG nuclease family protein [Candidatus Daviesbacteria bacterium]|nr:GIY-YIG nuclease family protein [Candidatus Daviesbacteria bacterium]